MASGTKPCFFMSAWISGLRAISRNAASSLRITASGVPGGTATPRSMASTRSIPCSLKVGAAWKSGKRSSPAKASTRILSLYRTKSSEFPKMAATWPPRNDMIWGEAPVKGT